MQSVVYTSPPARVIFGFSALPQLPAGVERLDLRRVLVLATRQQQGSAHRLAALLGERAASVYAGTVMYASVAVTEDATDRALATLAWNASEMERAAIRDLITRAWRGDPPEAGG